jgi:hypothetical protein
MAIYEMTRMDLGATWFSMQQTWLGTEAPSDDEDSDYYEFVGDLVLWCFYGGNAVSEPPAQVMVARNLDDAMQILGRAGTRVDMCGCCGEEARATTIAIRRRPATGENFDFRRPH